MNPNLSDTCNYLLTNNITDYTKQTQFLLYTLITSQPTHIYTKYTTNANTWYLLTYAEVSKFIKFIFTFDPTYRLQYFLASVLTPVYLTNG